MPYYGKLPIVLLSELAAGREDSYNCRIAAWLLGRLGQRVSVEQIAADCFVSRSAVSRFCRDIGLEDFAELKELLADSEKTFDRIGGDLPAREQGQRFARLAAESMIQAAGSLDYSAVQCLAVEIAAASRIACFGLLKAETAALSLQSDLVMLGKHAVTKVAFREQMEYLASAGPEDLVLIFSYRGVYFDYDLPREILRGQPRLWIVSGSRDAAGPLRRLGLRCDGVIAFDSRQDFVSHPSQLLIAAGIIAQAAARAIDAASGAPVDPSAGPRTQ